MKKPVALAIAGLALSLVLLAGCGTSSKTTTTTSGVSSATSTSATSTSMPSVTSTSAPGGSATTLATATPTIIPGSANVTYTNTKYGFSLKRPKTATLVTSGFSGSLPLTQKPVVGIVLPKSLSQRHQFDGRGSLYRCKLLIERDGGVEQGALG